MSQDGGSIYIKIKWCGIFKSVLTCSMMSSDGEENRMTWEVLDSGTVLFQRTLDRHGGFVVAAHRLLVASLCQAD